MPQRATPPLGWVFHEIGVDRFPRRSARSVGVEVGFEQPVSDPRPQPPSENGRRLLRALNTKIVAMETLLGNLHNTESRAGSSSQNVKVDLRARLTACYLARESLRRGELQGAENLEDLLTRLRVQIEHRKYNRRRRITRSEVRAVDLEELSRRLGE